MTPSRRAEQQAALRHDVLAAARHQLEEGGPTALSWRAIARAVGVGPSSLYTYYESLDALCTAVLVDAYDDLAAAVAGGVATAARNPAARLAAGAAAYRDWALANRARFNLLFTDVLPGYAAPEGGPTVAAQEAVFTPLIASIAALFGRADADLTTWPQAQRHAVVALWGQLHGLVSLEVNHHLDWLDADPQRRFRQQMAVAIAGLARSAGPDGPTRR